MNIGDRLYCYCTTNGNDSIDYQGEFIVGNWYVIKAFSEKLDESKNMKYSDYGSMTIINEKGNDEWFYIFDVAGVWYYGNWFYNNQEMRKVKIDRLEDYESWRYEEGRL